MFLQIVEEMPQCASSTVKKLRSIIDLTKGDTIIVSFDSLLRLSMPREELPPYSVGAFHTQPNKFTLREYTRGFIKLQTLYTEVLSLWNSADEIPAECHRAILAHYLLALLSSIVSRYPS